MSRTRPLLRDLHKALREAANRGMHADVQNQDALEDIADELLVWLLTDADGPDTSGTGWANVRVLFPKTNYPSRTRAILMLAKSGLSHSAIAIAFNLDRSTITRICGEDRSTDM
jgi:DNA-binding NarL/FixJ family response regulator